MSWTPEAFHQLAMFIEGAKLWEAADALEALARSGSLDGQDQLRMLALRTLLGIGWIGTPDFWVRQIEWAGAKWPGLIFRGLSKHGPTPAFARLPDLAHDRAAMRQILDLFPGLMRNDGLSMSVLKRECGRVLGSLTPDVSHMLQEWFVHRGEMLIDLEKFLSLFAKLRDSSDFGDFASVLTQLGIDTREGGPPTSESDPVVLKAG
jgi:hypothetical protein